MRHARWFVAALLAGRVASGQAAADERSEARKQFRTGVSHAKAGDLGAALRAFEAAYAVEPHYSVLYNIAQAELALGRPDRAVVSFERYLTEGGKRIEEARRAQVRALIESSRRRLGLLRLVADAPQRMRVWLDGRELGAERIAEPLVVVVGEHTITYAVGSAPPALESIVVSSGETTEVRLRESESRPLAMSAQLVVDCAVPQVSVQIDGVERAKTPLASALLVPAGEHVVLLSRRGYRPRQRRVAFQPGVVERFTCDERVASPLSPHLASGVRIRATPRDVLWFVDGRRAPSEPLPAGIHDLRVERDGFVPFRRVVSLTAGTTATFDVALEPTPESKARAERARARRATHAYWLGGTGAAALLAAGGLFVWNQNRYADWQAAPTTGSDFKRVASLQRVDDLSLGLVLLGTGLVTGAAWLLFQPEHSE